MIGYSRGWLRGWNRGYQVGAGHRIGRLRLVAFLLLLFSMLSFGAGLGFLWVSAEMFYQLSIGEPAKKVILHKWDSWHRVNGIQKKDKLSQEK